MLENGIFDEVHHCQETFRSLLHAVSNPGEVVSIDSQPEDTGKGLGALLTLALSLLDKETDFMVVENENLAEMITQMTYAKQRKKMAGFIFVPTPCCPKCITHIFSLVNPGSLAEPHNSSILIISIDSFEEEVASCLVGPGILGEKHVLLPQYARQWIHQRDEMKYEYPMGVEMVFITSKGKLMAIPRKIKMEE